MERFDIQIKKGQYYSFNFTIDDPDFAGFTTGWQAKLQARNKHTPSANPVIELTKGDGITLVNGEDRCEVEFTSSKTTVDPQKLEWDIKLTSPSGAVYYPYGGELLIKDPVTE